MLAVIVAALWLLVVWVGFVRGGIEVEGLAAYAMFGTALATLLLGVGTALMARETRASRKLSERLIEENHRLADAPRIRELIIQTINPLLESVTQIKVYHERREYMWVSPDLGTAKELLGNDQEVGIFRRGDSDIAFFPHPYVRVEEHAIALSALNQTLYRDLGRRHPSLVDRIQKYDKKAEDFRLILLDLAKAICSEEPPGRWGPIYSKYMDEAGLINGFKMRELALSLTCFTFHKSLGALEKFSYEQVKNEQHRDFWNRHENSIIEKVVTGNVQDKAKHIVESADDLAKELTKIEAELSQIKDRYRDEYHLTHGETERQETEPVFRI
jgi:hypothetical protein